MSLEKPKARGAQAVNNILSIYAEQPATLAELLACMKTSAKLRSIWRQVRAEMGSPVPKRSVTMLAQQQHRPPSPPTTRRHWGEGDFGEGRWDERKGPAPAKAPVPEAAAPSETSETNEAGGAKFGSGSWG